MKRLLSLLLASILLLSLCAPALAEINKDEIVTIDYFVGEGSGLQKDQWWTKYLEEKLGIRINYINYQHTDLSTYLAAQNLPDLIEFNVEEDLFRNAVDAGMLLNLDDYADQIPNVYAQITEYALDAQRTAGGGKLYSLPLLSSEYPATVGHVEYGMRLLVEPYEAYIEANGQPELNTIFDFIPVVKWMKENFPKTKVGQKTFGFSFFTDWDGSSIKVADFLMQMEGYYTQDMFPVVIDVDDMSTSYIFEDDSVYKRALQFWYEVNQAGLLDADTLTQTFDDYGTRASGGRVLAGLTQLDPTSTTNPSVLIDYADYHPVNYAGPMTLGNFDGTQRVAVSAKSEHIDKILALLNLACDYDEVWYCMYGPQGVYWDLDEEGNPYITEYGAQMEAKQLTFDDGGSPGLSTTTPGDNLKLISWHTPHPEYGVGYFWGYLGQEETAKDARRRAFYTDYYDIDLGTQFKGDRTVLEAIGKEAVYRGQLIDTTKSEEVIDILTRAMPFCQEASWLMIYAADQEEFDYLWEQLQGDMEALGMRDVYEYEVERLQNGTILYEK